MSQNNQYSGKVIVFITGTSRGLGQQIAQLIVSDEHGFLNNITNESRIILMSRDQKGLEETKRLVKQSKAEIKVDIVPIDLSNTNTISHIIEETLKTFSQDFDHAFLCSNAATLGDPQKLLQDHKDLEEIHNVYKLNIVLPSFLISRFCKHFEAFKRYVFNISSLGALQPYRSTGLYSTSKAAMDMFLRNLVADCPEVRALNYAPGPLDTKMARDLRDGTSDERTRNFLIDLYSSGKILSAEESGMKLIYLIRKNEFENSSYIDFYDV